MTEFGGPEVLRARRAADARARARRGADQGHARGAELRRHAHAHELLRAQGDAAARARAARSRACARTPASASSRWSATAATPSTRSRREELVFPIPDELDDGTALALLIQGLTAWHLYRTAARVGRGRERRRALGRRRRRLAGRAARPPAGRRARDRDRLERREARAGAGARRRRRDRLRAPRACASGCSRPTRDASVDVVFDMAGGGVFDASYAALAPFGRIVVYGIASQEPNEVRTGSLLRHSRAVVGFYLFHCLQRPGDGRRGAGRPVRACRARRAARGRRRHLPARSRPRRRTSTCASGARRASCCSTRR